jgi:hypothetical protein
MTIAVFMILFWLGFKRIDPERLFESRPMNVERKGYIPPKTNDRSIS